jgi:HK97 family phage major capsid protein
VINNLMPDVAAGSTPVAFGNWRQAYIVVNRRGVTVQNDPFSAGWCNLFKSDARIGGAVVSGRGAVAADPLSWPRAVASRARTVKGRLFVMVGAPLSD